jgi:hypothetical protein
MNKNIGRTDRYLRAIIGIVLLILAIYERSGLLGMFGLFFLFEAASSWCAFHQLIGRNTCPVGQRKNSFPLSEALIAGYSILAVAIVSTFLAKYLQWKTWHDLISNPSQAFTSLSMENIFFLFLVYPILLSLPFFYKFRRDK